MSEQEDQVKENQWKMFLLPEKNLKILFWVALETKNK